MNNNQIKEISFRVRIEGNQILSIVEPMGFSDGLSGKFEMIGILENLKQIELDKLKTKAYAEMDGDNNFTKVFELTDKDKSFLI